MNHFTVKIRPFDVPATVALEMPPGFRQNGMEPLPRVPLSELSIEQLVSLCNEFKLGVLEVAGKREQWEKQLQQMDADNGFMPGSADARNAR